MAERFVTFWPVDARKVHIRDLERPTVRYGRRGYSLCGAWENFYGDDEGYTVAKGDEDLLCATCTKIQTRRERAAAKEH